MNGNGNEPMDVAAADLMRVLQEKETAGLTWPAFKKAKREAVDAAERELAIVEACEDVCSATKPRKPRSDKGRKRSKEAADVGTDATES